MRKYNFEVKFTVPIEAATYEQAVRKADKQFPDVKGMTTFKVETDEYWFLPTKETLSKMHKWNECSCHNDENLTNNKNVDFWDFVDDSQSLTLKDETIFGSVINCTYVAVLLGFDLENARNLAITQGSLFKTNEDSSGQDFKDALWERDEGFNLQEFIDNVLTLYSYIKLNSEKLLDDDEENYIYDYLTKVKTEINTYTSELKD